MTHDTRWISNNSFTRKESITSYNSKFNEMRIFAVCCTQSAILQVQWKGLEYIMSACIFLFGVVLELVGSWPSWPADVWPEIFKIAKKIIDFLLLWQKWTQKMKILVWYCQHRTAHIAINVFFYITLTAYFALPHALTHTNMARKFIHIRNIPHTFQFKSTRHGTYIELFAGKKSANAKRTETATMKKAARQNQRKT